MAKIINGRLLASKIKKDIKQKVAKMTIKPGLIVVLVGDDPASEVYVKFKEKACKEVGFYSKKIALPASVSQKTLLKEIEQLNNDSKIHGILVQLPLPRGFNEQEVIQSIKPEKDVDCFHPINVGKLTLIKRIDDLNNFLAPCTAKGVVRLIEYVGRALANTNFSSVSKLALTASAANNGAQDKNQSQTVYKGRRRLAQTGADTQENCIVPRYQEGFIQGKKVVIVGRSNLVGKPLALLLLAKNATVTVCHSKTKDLKKETKEADILVAAVGKAGMITADMVKKNAFVLSLVENLGF